MLQVTAWVVALKLCLVSATIPSSTSLSHIFLQASDILDGLRRITFELKDYVARFVCSHFPPGDDHPHRGSGRFTTQNSISTTTCRRPERPTKIDSPKYSHVFHMTGLTDVTFHMTVQSECEIAGGECDYDRFVRRNKVSSSLCFREWDAFMIVIVISDSRSQEIR